MMAGGKGDEDLTGKKTKRRDGCQWVLSGGDVEGEKRRSVRFLGE